MTRKKIKELENRIANLKNEAIAQLAYRIGTSGYFRERENGNFIQLEVTLLK